MTELFLPVLGMATPVMAVVALTLISGKRLRGSCGGVGPDGSCTRCGKPASEIPQPAASDRAPCP